MGVLAAHVSKHHMHTQCLWRLKEDVGFPRTRGTASCYPLSGVLGIEPGQLGLFNWGISPALCTVILLKNKTKKRFPIMII